MGKVIGYIAAALLIFLGGLFTWGAVSESGSAGWIIVGVISIAGGL